MVTNSKPTQQDGGIGNDIQKNVPFSSTILHKESGLFYNRIFFFSHLPSLLNTQDTLIMNQSVCQKKIHKHVEKYFVCAFFCDYILYKIATCKYMVYDIGSLIL